jgi:hypothetical protein
MDRRKLLDNKALKLNDILQSEDLNLEIANNIENILELKSVIRMKATENYARELEKNR